MASVVKLESGSGGSPYPFVGNVSYQFSEWFEDVLNPSNEIDPVGGDEGDDEEGD